MLQVSGHKTHARRIQYAEMLLIDFARNLYHLVIGSAEQIPSHKSGPTGNCDFQEWPFLRFYVFWRSAGPVEHLYPASFCRFSETWLIILSSSAL
jgi:hypothetical protein